MSLYDEIIALYPELTNDDFGVNGFIALWDDSDGKGAYIQKWEYSKPLTDALKIYFRGATNDKS
jgi:hypothetical protein